METPPASIIIPTLNEEHYLPLLLHSLKDISSPLDIIVVDGASEDNTRRVVKEFQPLFINKSSLTLVHCAERNISLQRNLGAEKAKYDIFIFCDADVIFSSPLMYEKLVIHFQKKNYSVAAPILRPIEHGVLFRLMYQSLSSLQRLLLLFKRPFFPGSCLLTTRSVFESTGGFDTSILLAEDVDYSRRAAKFGLPGLISIRVPVSARRAIKYGYSWILPEIPNVFRLLFTGRFKHETIYYPFGEYSGKKAHHVNNQGEKEDKV
jgi:glycosyltransferase involved in cell wall biosynthesis